MRTTETGAWQLSPNVVLVSRSASAHAGRFQQPIIVVLHTIKSPHAALILFMYALLCVVAYRSIHLAIVEDVEVQDFARFASMTRRQLAALRGRNSVARRTRARPSREQLR